MALSTLREFVLQRLEEDLERSSVSSDDVRAGIRIATVATSAETLKVLALPYARHPGFDRAWTLTTSNFT